MLCKLRHELGGGGVGQGPCTRGRINIPAHNDIQDVCGTSRLVTALARKFSDTLQDASAVFSHGEKQQNDLALRHTK